MHVLHIVCVSAVSPLEYDLGRCERLLHALSKYKLSVVIFSGDYVQRRVMHLLLSLCSL